MVFGGGIAAFDLATWLGWAIWMPGMAAPAHGQKRLPSTGDDIGKFGLEFRGFITGFIRQYKPAAVVFELPFIGPKTHQMTGRKLIGLGWELEIACKAQLPPVDCFEVLVSPVRKHFCGVGMIRQTPQMYADGVTPRDALKLKVAEECERRGWHPETDDEADALAVLDWSAHKLDAPVPWDCRPHAERQAHPGGMSNAARQKQSEVRWVEQDETV